MGVLCNGIILAPGTETDVGMAWEQQSNMLFKLSKKNPVELGYTMLIMQLLTLGKIWVD